MSDAESGGSSTGSKKRSVLSVVLVTIALGAIGSGVWELLARPGLSSFGRFILDVLTLGSTTAKDSAYASAAIDPSPLSPLLVILLLSVLPLMLALRVVSIEFRLPFVKLFVPDPPKPETFGDTPDGDKKARVEIERWQKQVYKRRRVVSIVLIGFLVLTFAVAQLGVLILNQSVFIWRVFNANLAICAPYMDASEQTRYRARFAAMTTKVEYEMIQRELRDTAERNGSRLVPYETW